MPQFEGLELHNTTQYNLKYNSDTSLRKCEMSLINLPEDVSKIYKSALFEIPLRRLVRCFKNEYEMHHKFGIHHNFFTLHTTFALKT